MRESPRESMRLVGRVEEMARLRQAMDAACSGRGGALLVAGEAGIGKTRLVTELAAAAEASGVRVLSGRCIDLIGPAVPYYSLLEALRSVDRPEDPRDLVRPAAHTPVDGEGQVRLFERVWTRLGEIASVTPMLLALEDLHWADGSTLDFMVFLCRLIRRQPVLLVATYRSEDLRPGHALARTVVELVRSRDADVLDLGPLRLGEMAELIEHAAAVTWPGQVPGEVSGELIGTIVARSGGNPFFGEELLAAARRGQASLPTVLRVALRQRIDRVGPAGHRVLRVAAALGRDVPHRLLTLVADLTAAQLDAALRDAVDEGVLVVDQISATYRFRHALLAEVVYEAILPGVLPELHERLARVLAEKPELGGDPGELARHWEAAGRPAEAFAASVEAAQAAEAVYGFSEALEHLERALRLWHDTTDADRVTGGDRARLLTRAAELADLTGRGPRAAALIREAIAQVDEVADPARAGGLHARLGGYLLPTAKREAGLEACRRSVALVPADPPTPERAQALTTLGNGLLLSWRHAESERVCLEAVRTAEALGDPRPALRAYGLLGIDWCYRGRRDEALAQVRRALDLALAHGGARDIAHGHASSCEVLLATGCVAEAAQVALEGRAWADGLGVARSFGALLAGYAAEALLELGDWDRAESLLTDAHRTGTTFWSHYPHLVHGQLAAVRGRFAAARQHLDAGRLGARQPTSMARHARVSAELALWQGRPEEASRAVDEALGRPGRFRGALHTLSLATVGLCAAADQAQLVRTREQADAATAARRYLDVARRSARRAAVITPDARAWLARAEAEVSRLDGRADPQLWRAAVEAWEQLGRPYHTAYCRWRLAEALQALGPPARVEHRRALHAAYSAATVLGAVPLRRMVELAAQRARLDLADPLPPAEPGRAQELGLTNRELEVLRLLTRGHTNRDIAAELTISVKTASVHVSHILAKLGVGRRVEAAAIGQRLWAAHLGAEQPA